MLVVARHHDCQYIWHAHAPAALTAGVAADVIEAMSKGERPTFGQRDEAAVYEYCTELLENSFCEHAGLCTRAERVGGHRHRRIDRVSRLLRHGGDGAQCP